MHELGLSQNIVSTVLHFAEENKIDKILKVIIEVGNLSGVVPESLKFCFDVCVQGTMLEGTTFEMHKVEAIGQCKICEQKFHLTKCNFSCPACEKSEWELISGKEFVIKGVEVL